jgi:glycosyltransferase involved in cell wall biosynthesis
MKIAFIGNLPPASIFPPNCLKGGRSGVEHPAPWMVALLPALRELTGFQLRVILCHRAILKRCLVENDGVEYLGIPNPIPARLGFKSLFYRHSLFTTPALREYRPDLVHAYGFETGNALVAIRSGFPVSAFIQGIAELLEPFSQNLDWIDRKSMVHVERQAVSKVRWAVAENEFAKRWMLSRNTDAMVDIIPHPTREVFFEKSAPIFGDSILTVGGLDRRKGMDTLISAFARVPSKAAKLVITGDGHLLPKLRELAASLGIESRVEFTGGLSTPDVIQRMNAARAFVIASRMDTSPNVVSEAHAIGLPVIGTRVGGIPEMIDEGEDGFLVDCDDTDTMAARIHTLLEDRDLARKLGAVGQTKVRTLNDSTRVAEAHVDFFQKIGKDLGIL